MTKEGEGVAGATRSYEVFTRPCRVSQQICRYIKRGLEGDESKGGKHDPLYLTDDVIYNVMDEETATRLWSRLETLYMTKSLSNKLYLKK